MHVLICRAWKHFATTFPRGPSLNACAQVLNLCKLWNPISTFEDTAVLMNLGPYTKPLRNRTWNLQKAPRQTNIMLPTAT